MQKNSLPRTSARPGCQIKVANITAYVEQMIAINASLIELRQVRLVPVKARCVNGL